MTALTHALDTLDRCTAPKVRGVVRRVQGLAVSVGSLPAPIGAQVVVHLASGSTPRSTPGEVVGLDGRDAVVMLLGDARGVGRGDLVELGDREARAVVGGGLIGRVVDALGRPIDGKGPLSRVRTRPLSSAPVAPMDRPLIDRPLATGVRALDALLPLGRGQRLGIFAAPGVGKSTLLAACAKHTAADVSVIALVGERGREIKHFVEKALGPEGLARSVVVAATGDEPALLRLRAARAATAIAEDFRDAGRDVLLVMDSVTRFAQAQRQVGLSAGEPPTTRGYPPSVFSSLADLLERSGRTSAGSITGLYSVLVEGQDMDEPIADACRGILDGHVLLDRKLAERGHFPAIDIPGSISRVAGDVTDATHTASRREVSRLIAAYREVEDLVQIGAYAPGSSPDADLAIAAKPAIDRLLQQSGGETATDFAGAAAQLTALCHLLQKTRDQIAAAVPPAAR